MRVGVSVSSRVSVEEPAWQQHRQGGRTQSWAPIRPGTEHKFNHVFCEFSQVLSSVK